ncbi:MAG: 2-oxoacid:ferredoxin oxidoreductase subunit beta [Candidatus Hydrogenedentota bacterium]|nr:MAG: 2-oxoacid:ferredoxin oxidoreductase subunit beta [Candidatus Hydrogenedentota bacterium]
MHKYIRSTKKFPHLWCPGCGNGIGLSALVRAVDGLGFPRNDVILVSGIGCAARAPVYVDFNTLHTTHGRALTFATGIKLVKPHLHVIVIMGDGDAVAIGGNHFIHSCRRNIEMTALVFNNRIYGMTGGQSSPATPHGGLATTAPYGKVDNAFDISNLAASAGATFVARGTTYYARQTEEYIRRALAHKGFAVVEIVSQCPTIYGRLNKMGSGVEMMKWQKDNAIPLEKVRNRWSDQVDLAGEGLAGKFLTGVFVERQAPEFVSEYYQLIEKIGPASGRGKRRTKRE